MPSPDWTLYKRLDVRTNRRSLDHSDRQLVTIVFRGFSDVHIGAVLDQAAPLNHYDHPVHLLPRRTLSTEVPHVTKPNCKRAIASPRLINKSAGPNTKAAYIL